MGTLIFAGKPALEFLPCGEVLPDGWLKQQMQRDISSGYARYLPALTDRCHLDVFDMRDAETLNSGEGGNKGELWWDGETTGNYLDGFIRMAYLSGDRAAMRKADEYVKTILSFQEPDGYLGVYPRHLRYPSPMRANGELWTQACLYRGMLAYYQLTGDDAVLRAVEKATRLTMSQYGEARPYWAAAAGARGGPGHNMMFVDVCEQLYRITGARAYLEFAKFLYDSWNELGQKKQADTDQLLRNLADLNKPLTAHGAHIAEHIRVPFALYCFEDAKTQYQAAYQNWFTKIDRHLTPSGALICDEDVKGRSGSADIGAEYCGIFELLFSLQSALEKTAAASFGDQIEKLAFNPAQGARLGNGTAIQYLTKDNQTSAPAQGHGGRFMLSPTHEQAAVCCVPNAVRFSAYYVSQMWMRTNGQPGIAAVAYGPSLVKTTINGQPVRIREETAYPFEDRVRFTIHPAQQTVFSVWLRDPQWSENTRVTCSGATVTNEDGWIKLHKVWRPGDQIELDFDADIRKQTTGENEIYFSRGPLLYSLGFDPQLTRIKQYPVEEFRDMTAAPAPGQSTSFAYQNDSDFVFEGKSQVIETNPWENPNLTLQGTLFDQTRQKTVNVELIPLGASGLRQTTFPVKNKKDSK